MFVSCLVDRCVGIERGHDLPRFFRLCPTPTPKICLSARGIGGAQVVMKFPRPAMQTATAFVILQRELLGTTILARAL
jgi:hypothetical protein